MSVGGVACGNPDRKVAGEVADARQPAGRELGRDPAHLRGCGSGSRKRVTARCDDGAVESCAGMTGAALANEVAPTTTSPSPKPARRTRSVQPSSSSGHGGRGRRLSRAGQENHPVPCANPAFPTSRSAVRRTREPLTRPAAETFRDRVGCWAERSLSAARPAAAGRRTRPRAPRAAPGDPDARR